MTSAAISPSEAPRLQRARGEGRIAVRAESGATRLSDLYQSGAAKVRLPRRSLAGAEAILINSAGGLTDGDRLAFHVAAEAGAALTVTTQSCERIYRSLGGRAEVDIRLTVGPGARLDWLPQETILFDRSSLERRLKADIAEDGTLLAVEAVIFGRTAMGESVGQGAFHDRWRIRRGGRIFFADDVAFRGDLAEQLRHNAILAGATATATLFYAGEDAERHVDAVRAALGERGGASAWDGRLLARVVAVGSLELRRALVPAIAALRDGAPLPRPWQS